MALISVIIPIYNGEDYIDRCMQTLVNQTIGIENLEIILVNDASTDNSLNKLMEWEQKYPESILVVTYEENLMQGGARNLGIKYASSDYIAFVDQDDWVELDMYEILYKHTDNNYYDHVIAKYVNNVNGQDLYENVGKREDISYNFPQMEDGYYYSKEINKIGNNGEWGGVWCAIYRRNIIIENNIWFPEHIIYDDNYFVKVFSLYTSKIYIVDKVLYHYYIHTDSTFHEKNTLKHLDRITSELAIIDAYKERGLFDKLKDELEYDFISHFYLDTLYLMFSTWDTLPYIFEDKFEYMKQKVNELFPDYMNNKKVQEIKEPFFSLLRLLKIPYKIPIEGLNDVKSAYCEIMDEFKKLQNYTL